MKFETNTISRSEMTTCGILCLVYTLSHRIFTQPSDKSSVEHVMGMISLEKQSTIIMIMSTEMWVQGSDSILSGWSGVAFA